MVVDYKLKTREIYKLEPHEEIVSHKLCHWSLNLNATSCIVCHRNPLGSLMCFKSSRHDHLIIVLPDPH
jgi:hypothetical protein